MTNYARVSLDSTDDAPKVEKHRFSPVERFIVRCEDFSLYLNREQLDQLGASIVAALHTDDDPMPADVEQRVTAAIREEASRS